jgi:hypothetical protein
MSFSSLALPVDGERHYDACASRQCHFHRRHYTRKNRTTVTDRYSGYELISSHSGIWPCTPAWGLRSKEAYM